jgi:CheY-like chemotaxis protein
VPLNSEFDDLGEDDGERASILIVDDLPEKLLVFQTVLEDLGHDLVCARSGAQALKEILKTEFAAILLDVNMPDIDGFETAKLIRQYKRSARTPIIFVTSYADEMQTSLGYSLGAVDYILSPVNPDVLRSKVKVFVDLHLTQRRLRRRANERVALAAAEAARHVAEENTRRSHFFSHASRELGSSLDSEVTGTRLLEMLGAALRQRGDARALRPGGRLRPRPRRQAVGRGRAVRAAARGRAASVRRAGAADERHRSGAANVSRRPRRRRRSSSCRCRTRIASSVRSAFGRATGPIAPASSS